MSDAAEDHRLSEVLPLVHALTDRYRARCLWFLDRDYYPGTAGEVGRVLEYIERYGDVEAFRAAGTIRQWLSATSSDRSARS